MKMLATDEHLIALISGFYPEATGDNERIDSAEHDNLIDKEEAARLRKVTSR